MKEVYVVPEMELVYFEVEDILTSSNELPPDVFG